MSGWGQSLDDLAGATASLLVQGVDGQVLIDPQAALAARDAVVIELRELIGAVSDVPRFNQVRELTVFDLVHRPGQALHQALSELPRTVPFGATPPSRSKREPLPAYEASWQRAAGASLGLEGYVDALGRLPDQHAWNVLRDLADVAAAVPYLDHDLAEALLPRLEAREDLVVPYGLLIHPGHDAVRIAAGEIRARVPAAEGHSGSGERAHVGQHDRPAEARGMSHLMTQLMHAVSTRGANLSVPDLRAVTRLLEVGGTHAAQLLRLAGPDPELADAAAHGLEAVSTLARKLRGAPVTSMTTAHLDLLRGANTVQDQMGALAVQGRRLASNASARDLRRLAWPGLEFAERVPHLTHALLGSVREALARGIMLVPSVPDRRNTHALAWVTATMGPQREGPPAVLAIADELSSTARGITPMVRQSIERLSPQAGEGSRSQQGLDAARLHAGTARSELRQVLGLRHAAQPSVLTAAMPTHPQLAPVRSIPGAKR